MSNGSSDHHPWSEELIQTLGRPVPRPVWPSEVSLVGTVNDDTQHVKASPGGIPGGPVDAPVQVLVLVVPLQGLGSLHTEPPSVALRVRIEAVLALGKLKLPG